MLPDDVERLAAFEEPDGEQIQLLAGTDSLFLLRRNAADLFAEEDQAQAGAGLPRRCRRTFRTTPSWTAAGSSDSGSTIPAKERIAPWLFHGPTPAVRQRIAEVEAWIREDLGDFRSFSLDSPASRQKRIDALEASASRLRRRRLPAVRPASRNGSGAVRGEEIPQQRAAFLLPHARRTPPPSG